MLDRPRFLGLFALALSCVFGEHLNIFQTPRPDPGVRVRSGPEQVGRRLSSHSPSPCALLVLLGLSQKIKGFSPNWSSLADGKQRRAGKMCCLSSVPGEQLASLVYTHTFCFRCAPTCHEQCHLHSGTALQKDSAF